MRHNNVTRTIGVFAGFAAAAAMSACGSGSSGSGSPATTTVAPPVAAAKALTAAELPAGLTFQAVQTQSAEQAAIAALESVRAATYTPAACKDPNLAAQSILQQTTTAGSEIGATGSGSARYGVTLLPGDVEPATFAAAATGQCASVTIASGGESMTKQSTRESLPSSVSVPGGFVLVTRAGGQGDKGVEQVTAYLNTNGTMVIVTAGASAGASVDRTVFDDLLARAVKKVQAH